MAYNANKLYHKTEEKMYFILKCKQLQYFKHKGNKSKMRLLMSKNQNLKSYFKVKFSKKIKRR